MKELWPTQRMECSAVFRINAVMKFKWMAIERGGTLSMKQKMDFCALVGL